MPSLRVLAAFSLVASLLPSQSPLFEPLRVLAGHRSSGWEALVAGDIDRDGDIDLALGFGGTVHLRWNNGDGGFAGAAMWPLSGSPWIAALALSDIDRDGDLDLMVACDGAQDRLFISDGTGGLVDATATHLPPWAGRSTSLAIEDVDGDGDVDVVVGEARAQDRLLQNDGTGRFTDVTASGLPVDTDWTSDLLLVDVDGDGDVDCVSATGGACRLLANDGTGRFTDVTTNQMPMVPLSRPDCVAAGDVDGDGDLDLVLGDSTSHAKTTGPERLYLNDGAGNFSAAPSGRLPSPPLIGGASDVVLCDFDGDSDLDLMSSRWEIFASGVGILVGTQDRLYVNDGSGWFADVTDTHLAQEAEWSRMLIPFDVDGDGDTDVVAGRRNNAPRVLTNLRRQLHSPAGAVVGQSYNLDVYSRYSPGLAHVALAYVSTRRGPSVPIPSLGTLGLDPSTAIPLSPVLIPQPQGVAQASIAIPNDPTLAGLPLFGQALIAPWPFGARLTNVTRDRIR